MFSFFSKHLLSFFCFGGSLDIKCKSGNNQLYSNESLNYSFAVGVNKCGESCDTINDPYLEYVFLIN